MPISAGVSEITANHPRPGCSAGLWVRLRGQRGKKRVELVFVVAADEPPGRDVLARLVDRLVGGGVGLIHPLVRLRVRPSVGLCHVPPRLPWAVGFRIVPTGVGTALSKSMPTHEGTYKNRAG